MVLKPVRPLKINRIPENRLEIHWNDERITFHTFHRLRCLCACAQCRDEMTGKCLVKPGDIARDIEPHAINPIGSYALQFCWSDGHQTGLYTFEYLRDNDEGERPVQAPEQNPTTQTS
jgi:DUF971 family protein